MAKIKTKTAIESKEEDQKNSNKNHSYDITITNNPIKIHHKLREHMTDLEQIFFLHGEKATSKLDDKELVTNSHSNNVEDGEEE